MSTDKILGDQYRVGAVIGHGASSVVYECTDITTHNRYAVKVLNKAQVRRLDMEEAFEREAMALKSLTQCAYVTRAIDILQSTRNYYVVMDLADRGSLLQHVVKTNGGNGLTPAAVRRYFQQLLQGLRYMHSKEIVHRDIKPENLLLDQWRTIKISDFGFAAKASITRRLYRQCGTPQYVAPEVLSSTDGYIGQYADIWSAGVTLYVMLCGQLPFAAHDNDRLYELIQEGKYPPPRRPDGLAPVPPSAIHLVKCCLDLDPTRRWTAAQLLKHPFLNGYDDVCTTRSDGAQTSLTEMGVSIDPDALDGLVQSLSMRGDEGNPLMGDTTGPSQHRVSRSHSCPNLLELDQLGIDIFNDPQLGRKRRRPLRKFFQGESTENLSDLAGASADEGLDEQLQQGSSATHTSADREGLGKRSALTMLRTATFTDESPQSPLRTPRDSDHASNSSGRISRKNSVDAAGFETPPVQTKRPASGTGSRPSTTPHDPVRFAKPISRRFRLVHVWLFVQFVLVLIIVTGVALLKIMFDVRVHKLPLPKKLRVMVENLIDTAGFGAPPTPAGPSPKTTLQSTPQKGGADQKTSAADSAKRKAE
eukprot:CAMPEP_0174831220 /NCGR_PEP_ID=MMETSP1114-20130205/2971_1 /TAXON_ID=312471 /ORGANISM="Neobodo designis, Strain CCAP 1951/1" /LENGTH=589 /DNA_ID=CAMNT_0016065041 /DNA_START=426 /DNA_END=2195 /DNA_ORIENTATION=-